MRQEFKIRKATLNDIKPILDLNLKLFKNEYKNFDDTLNLKWTFSEGKKFFRDRIIKESGFIEVVECKGKVIGYLCGLKGRWHPAYRKKFNYGVLDNMFIEEKYRNKGLGTKLCKNFKKWCKENKFDLISVTASFKNKQGISFYRKLGFKDYDLTLESRLKNNA